MQMVALSHQGPHLNILGLSLADEDAVEVKLLVRKLDLRRGHIGAEYHHRLRPVLELDRQLQGSDPVGESLPVSIEKTFIRKSLQKR